MMSIKLIDGKYNRYVIEDIDHHLEIELRLTNFLQAKAIPGRQLKSPCGGVGEVKKKNNLEESAIKAAEWTG